MKFGREERLQRLRDNRAFRATFATFLRHRDDDWRARRVDHFAPVELYAASRRITLHAQINRALLAQFARREKKLLPSQTLRDLRVGTTLPLHVPFASFTKRPWLNFSMRDGAGVAVPVLTRFEGSTITGGNLLRVFESAAEHLPDPIAREDQRGPWLVAAALAAVNPTGLERRLVRWRPDWAQHQQDLVSAWTQHEANLFQSGLGAKVKELLEDKTLFEGQTLAAVLSQRVNECPQFQTIPGLVLFGIRDVLKLILDWTPFEDRRTLLEPGNTTLADVLEFRLIPGLKYFNKIVTAVCHAESEDPETAGAIQELATAILFWTAYAQVEVKIGEPFLLKSEETISFPREHWKFRIWTRHNYQLALHDAVATHVEITTDDPELEIPRRWHAIRRLRAVQLRAADGRWREPSEAFGTDYQDSARITHFYTSRRPSEQRGNTDRGLHLVVRYRISRSVVRGYSFLTAGLLLAASWACYQWIDPAIRDRPPHDEGTLVLVSVTLVVLPLWFTVIQHKKPLVHQKLRTFRILLYTALSALILGPIVAHSWRLFN